MIDRSQVQVTIQWAKVTHLNRVKRISKPSSELDIFISQVKAHFKELESIEYLYEADGTRRQYDGDSGRKFVLQWHSQSPNDASVLDMSMNSVEVMSQDQFFEILCTHAIVDRNNGRVSTPRFTIVLLGEEAEGEKQLAGIEVSLHEQDLIDLSVIRIDSSRKEDDSPAIAEPAAQPEPAVDLSQAVQPMLEEDKAMNDEEEKKDAKVKASEILQSVFGDGAEDAVSMDGAISDDVREGNEELAQSVVEEAYYVDGSDANYGGEGALSLVQSVEQAKAVAEAPAQAEVYAAHDNLADKAADESPEAKPREDTGAQIEHVPQVIEQPAEKDVAQNEPELAPLQDRMPSFDLPLQMPAPAHPIKESKVVKIDASAPEEEKKVEEQSESSSDSDFDMLEALENSQELQTYIREQIRGELKTIGPQVFDKLKGEFNLKEVAAQCPENLRVSWQHENDKEEVFHDAIEAESEQAAADDKSEAPDLDESVRESIQRVIEERMSISMIEDGMQGGWQQEHVHSSVEDSAILGDAPDKGDAAESGAEEQKIPVLRRSAEPIVVEYNPENDQAAASEQQSFIDVEDESNLLDIHMKAKLEQPEQREPEQQRPADAKGLFKSIIGGFKELIGEASGTRQRKNFINQVALANGPDYAEVYTEVTRKDGHRAYAKVNWKLRNVSEEFCWSKKMQLVPVMSSPTLRVHFESNIADLRPGGVEDLNIKVRIPEEFSSNHLILFLKLKQGRRFLGPSMLLFVKIIKSRSSEVEESSFVQEDQVDELVARGDGSQAQLRLIAQGKEVFNEQQLLHMGSILCDEGYGSFDRCMLTLRALRGDIEKARKTLTQITFAEVEIQ